MLKHLGPSNQEPGLSSSINHPPFDIYTPRDNDITLSALSGLVTFDSLHLIFGIMESFRTSFFYPDFLLLAFPWFHYPFYRVSE